MKRIAPSCSTSLRAKLVWMRTCERLSSSIPFLYRFSLIFLSSVLLFQINSFLHIPIGFRCLLSCLSLIIVFRYIIATKTHKIDPSSDDTDLKYFLDFDLAVLGKPTEDYNRYAHQIRREYIHVPDEKYLTGRAAVLDHLRQGDLYFTAEFRELFDSKARENLSREIVSLKQGNVYI